MASKRPAVEKPRPTKSRPDRPKLDYRFAWLLSLSPARLKALKERDDAMLAKAADKGRCPPPLSAGIYFPPTGKGATDPARLKVPYASVFLLSDASSKDLEKLGMRVRSQAGDIFTVFVPLSLVPKLEGLDTVRFIELARPLAFDLDRAVPFAQIDTLHTAGTGGAGVIVGVVDLSLDFYHPDFREPPTGGLSPIPAERARSRVLFLWDQKLDPRGFERSPPMDLNLPTQVEVGSSYGVEYSKEQIDAELTRMPGYSPVRHRTGADPDAPGLDAAGHGTHVTGIAAGNGAASEGRFTGAAPEADIIFVKPWTLGQVAAVTLADTGYVMDAIAYIFARASLLGKPCVVNLSASDNIGPHDGTTLGEQFIDNLLLVPGRALTLAAGNTQGTLCNADGVPMSVNHPDPLVFGYDRGPVDELAPFDDSIELWYDGQDRFEVVLEVPGDTRFDVPRAPVVLGPVLPGAGQVVRFDDELEIHLFSRYPDPRNGSCCISIVIFTGFQGAVIPRDDWVLRLTATTSVNGRFKAWIDRSNRGVSRWKSGFINRDEITVATPATARRAITVGNHRLGVDPLRIESSSGSGPTRDGRIKPEIAAAGTNITAARAGATAVGDGAYVQGTGTSMSAPLVAGACALLFECRGPTATCADLKQILEDTAGRPTGVMIPDMRFGFGFLQMGAACSQPPGEVDVWLRDDATDGGTEPYVGEVFWASPDIALFDRARRPIDNPTYDPSATEYTCEVQVTVRNRGTATARNSEVRLYWADPSTNLPFPEAWNAAGIFGISSQFPVDVNRVIVRELAAGGSETVTFGWSPPAPDSSLRHDNHFCLLARIENEVDASEIGAGGWNAVTASNNIALHNVWVQRMQGGGGSGAGAVGGGGRRQRRQDMGFHVVGTGDQDSLTVQSELLGGEIGLTLPIEVLPWRELKTLEKLDMRRLPFGVPGWKDPLAVTRRTLKGREVRLLTDVVGASRLELQNGLATIWAEKDRLWLPEVRMMNKARMTAVVRVRDARIGPKGSRVHVGQLSGGLRVGGVALELRPYEGRRRKSLRAG